MSDHNTGLANSALSALKWNYAGAATRAVLQILIGAILARILGPKPFGLVAVATLFISLGNLVAEFGFGAALVQKHKVTQADIRYVFTMQVVSGVLMTAITAALAGPVAVWFGQHDIVPVLRVLSVLFLIQSLGQTAFSLLKRNLDFRTIQKAQVISYLISYLGFGIPMALFDLGVWSLIVAQLIQSAMYAIQLYRRVRHSVQPLFHFKDWRQLVRFGMSVTATNVVNWTISNGESVLIGRVYGIADLGVYNRASVLLTTPMHNVVAVLQGVLFPTYSKAQDDLASQRKTYLASIGVMGLIMFPVFGTVALVPQTVVFGLYGAKWSEAVPLLIPLALAMPVHAIMALAGPLMWGKGRVGVELRVQLVVVAVGLLFLWLASTGPIRYIGWAVFATYIVRFVLMTSAVLRELRLTYYSVFRAVKGSLLLGAGTALATWAADKALTANLNGPTLLAADILVAGAVGIGLVVAFPGSLLSPDVSWIIRRTLPILPGVLRKRISAVIAP